MSTGGRVGPRPEGADRPPAGSESGGPAPTAPIRPWWSPSLALTIAVPAIYVLTCGLLLLRKGDNDWDQLLAFHLIERWNGQLSGLAKHWNPLMAGGMSLAGDPQVPVLSPSMLLARVLPLAAALKLSLLFFVGLGWTGTFLLARRLALDRATAALAASLFAGSGYIVSHLHHGHIGFLGTLTLPLWLWASRVAIPGSGEPPGRVLRRLLALVLGGGVLFALSIDGSPMVILLLLVWVGLDAALLGWQRRSFAPLAFFAGAVATGAALDAIYVLPMVANQTVFPRLRRLEFVNPALFFWFLLLPMRGKVIPAPANGHEFSLYIGPVLASLLIRQRAWIGQAFPADERRRALVMSAVTFVIGLGAFRALSPWLPPGPFDLLHALPGFRTVNIPSRFWGYLALPLALAGAVAIRRFETAPWAGARTRLVWALLFLFALPFQVVSLASPFLNRLGRGPVPARMVAAPIRTIVNVEGPVASQALALAPDVGIIQAYNLHDYIRGAVVPGQELIRPSADDGAPGARAEWRDWSEILVTLPAGGGPGVIVLNQNFHPTWRATPGEAARDGAGNLVLRLPVAVPAGTTVRLWFRDEWSVRGASVSRVAALAFGVAAAGLAAVEIGSPLRRGRGSRRERRRGSR